VVDKIAAVPLGGEPADANSPQTTPVQPVVITGTTVATP
jgi:hypothetical protein